MAFNFQGQKSIALAVTSTGVTQNLPADLQQCRIWNEGPNPARMIYADNSSAAATDTDLVMPVSFIEVHEKGYNNWLAAKTKPGETATLHIICGRGD